MSHIIALYLQSVTDDISVKLVLIAKRARASQKHQGLPLDSGYAVWADGDGVGGGGGYDLNVVLMRGCVFGCASGVRDVRKHD